MVGRHADPVDSLLSQEDFDGDVFLSEQMSRHTTYRIGGSARYYVRVHSEYALISIIDICSAHDINYMVIGKGSNLLVNDKGYDGVIIALGRDFKKYSYNEDSSTYTIGAGVILNSVVVDAFRRGLGGIEWAVGTPGTFGGAIRMNAGSGSDWISHHIKSVTCYQRPSGIVRYNHDEIEWGYRSSSFSSDSVILSCELNVENVAQEHLHGKMEGSLARRKRSQPLNFPSCGSVFKNPEGKSAGALIEQAGLKGRAIGGARISDIHANFIVNENKASSQDVIDLIELAQSSVFDQFGVELQLEVKLVGF